MVVMVTIQKRFHKSEHFKDLEFEILIAHSHQKLSCLKSGVSYSPTVSLPVILE